MEPAINPGLEAQAAARIHRLGRVTASPSSILFTHESECHGTMSGQMHNAR